MTNTVDHEGNLSKAKAFYNGVGPAVPSSELDYITLSMASDLVNASPLMPAHMLRGHILTERLFVLRTQSLDAGYAEVHGAFSTAYDLYRKQGRHQYHDWQFKMLRPALDVYHMWAGNQVVTDDAYNSYRGGLALVGEELLGMPPDNLERVDRRELLESKLELATILAYMAKRGSRKLVGKVAVPATMRQRQATMPIGERDYRHNWSISLLDCRKGWRLATRVALDTPKSRNDTHPDRPPLAPSVVEINPEECVVNRTVLRPVDFTLRALVVHHHPELPATEEDTQEAEAAYDRLQRRIRQRQEALKQGVM